MLLSNHKYKQLSIYERIKLETLYHVGDSIHKIAKTLHRSPSTISRELHKGRYKAQYHAHIAQKRTNIIRGRRPTVASNQQLMEHIERMIKMHWSPEIISHKLDGKVSHMSVYTITKTCRPEWRKYLKYRKKAVYHKGSSGKTLIPNRVDISERPGVRFGDWEADTVIGSRGSRSCLGVFVEKTSRIYKVVKMMNKTADEMIRAALIALEGSPVNSITYDNGSENTGHEWINRLLRCKSYFARPYCSCDKGQIENRNGWLRVYLPKKTNFDLISESELGTVEAAINNRPLKCLNWMTPIEALHSQMLQFNF